MLCNKERAPNISKKEPYFLKVRGINKVMRCKERNLLINKLSVIYSKEGKNSVIENTSIGMKNETAF